MTGRPLVCVDIDRTVSFSRAAGAGPDVDGLVVVEMYQGAPYSFCTPVAAQQLTALCDIADVVPVTTRTAEQFARINLPGGPCRYALVANGARLLVDGAPDAQWSTHTAALLRACAPLAQVWEHVQRSAPASVKVLKCVEDLFCYAVLYRDRVADAVAWVADMAAWAAERGWVMSQQGRKVYWLPGPLSKGTSARRLAEQLGSSTLLAAGDSRLDAPLLAAADAAVVVAGGELAADGFSGVTMRTTACAGPAGGEQAVTWLLEWAHAGAPHGH